jgi:hypothetical protein
MTFLHAAILLLKGHESMHIKQVATIIMIISASEIAFSYLYIRRKGLKKPGSRLSSSWKPLLILGFIALADAIVLFFLPASIWLP